MLVDCRAGTPMRRRDIIATALFAAVWPVRVRAQGRIPVVGMLSSRSALEARGVVTAFLAGLEQAGFIEGRNVSVMFRWAEGAYDRLPALVADLLRNEVDVIVTGGGVPPALAAQAATRTIP